MRPEDLVMLSENDLRDKEAVGAVPRTFVKLGSSTNNQKNNKTINKNVVKTLSMRISKHSHHHLTVVVVLVLVPLATSFSSSTLIYSPKAKPVLQMVPVE